MSQALEPIVIVAITEPVRKLVKAARAVKYATKAREERKSS